jgi:hypothetical protein
MRISSLFVTSPAVAISSIALLLGGLSGTGVSQAATPSGGATTSLPGVAIEAPKQVTRPKHSAVARSARSRRTSQTTQTPSAPDSVSAKLARLEKTTGNCVDGCATSLRYGNAPWHGCSGSGWPALSPTCRNMGNYKTYAECVDGGLVTGWRNNEVGWYCSSLALK